MEFCAIAPTKYLENISGRPIHLVLSHLVESNPEYAKFYRSESEMGSEIILDNSAFEMYKQGKPMYSSSKLIEMGTRVGADYIVLSDYPGEPGQKTIDTAEELIPAFKEAGFKTFFVPQSKVGDLDDYISTWEWAAKNPNIDLIGLSILGAPNAFGVEADNKLQRYMSRYHILNILYDEGIMPYVGYDRIHCLGMVDGPNELFLLEQYSEYIKSIDSSSPIWAGMCGISYDSSPTGLINGKNEVEVDFDLSTTDCELALNNLAYIDRLLERTK